MSVLLTSTFAFLTTTISPARADSTVESIMVGDAPFGIALNSSGTRAYVANSNSSNVSVIDLSTNLVLSNIATGNRPYKIALHPEDTFGYVTIDNGPVGDGAVEVFDLSTNTLVGSPITVDPKPVGIAVHPDGTKMYVTHYLSSGSVSVINTSDNSVIREISVGNSPRSIKITPDGARAYVVNQFSDSVNVIDLNTYAVTSINGFNEPIEIDSNSIGSRMYVTNSGSNSVSVIDTSSNTISETISDVTQPFGVTFKNNYLYVAKSIGNLVFKIDLSINEIVESIIVGSMPRFVGVNESGTFGYVTNLGSDSISVIKLTFESITYTDWVGAQSISCPAPNPWVKEQLGFASSVQPVLVSAENTIGKSITQGSYDALKSSGVLFDTVSTKVSTATETLPIYGCKDKLLSGKVNQPIQFIAGGYTLQSNAHGYINTADLKWHDTNGVTLYTNTAAFMHTIKFTNPGKYVVVLTEQPDTSRGLIPTYGVRSVRFVININ